MKVLLVVKGKIRPRLSVLGWFRTVRFTAFAKVSVPALPSVGLRIEKMFKHGDLAVVSNHLDFNIGEGTWSKDIVLDQPNDSSSGVYVVTCGFPKLTLAAARRKLLKTDVEEVIKLERRLRYPISYRRDIRNRIYDELCATISEKFKFPTFVLCNQRDLDCIFPDNPPQG